MVGTMARGRVTIRPFDSRTYLKPKSFFLNPFLDYFHTCTDAPTIFGFGVALVLLGQSLRSAKVNLTPQWKHNIFIFLLGVSGQSRKTTTLGLMESLGVPLIPMGSIEATIQWLKIRDEGVLTVDECSGILKMCSRPSYLQGLTEFFNRLHDCTPVENNTKRDGLVRVEEHYVSLALATTDEGFRASVTDEMLRNGFVNRFLPLIGVSTSRPRGLQEGKSSTSKELVSKLERLKRTNVSFKHSDRTALLASEVAASVRGLDTWLTVRAEEQTLRIADLLALDGQCSNLNGKRGDVEVEVTEGDTIRAREFVAQTLTEFQNLVRIAWMPPGALQSLYQTIHKLRSNHSSRFTKADILKASQGLQVKEVENALDTAQEAGFIKAKFNERKGIVYTILEDPFLMAN